MSGLSVDDRSTTPTNNATEHIVREGSKHGADGGEANVRHITLAQGVAPDANRPLDDVVEPTAGGAKPDDADVFRLPPRLVLLGLVLPDKAGEVKGAVVEDEPRPAALHDDDGITTWIAPNPGAASRAGYFAAQGLPLPVGCGPDGRLPE